MREIYIQRTSSNHALYAMARIFLLNLQQALHKSSILLVITDLPDIVLEISRRRLEFY